MSDPLQRLGLKTPHGPPKTERVALGPSWLVSVVLHGGLVVALWAALPGLRGGMVGAPAGAFRQIGIYVGRSGEGGGDGGKHTTGLSAEKQPSHQQPPATSVVPPSLTPPANVGAEPIQPPATRNPSPVIGPGGSAARAIAEIGPADKTNRGRPTSERGTVASGPSTGGPRGSRGTNAFFGIWDGGAKFVYLIDCSGSMFAHNAMQAAKNELIASLATLKRSQQFQVIFYNSDLRWMKTSGKTDCRYFSAHQDERREALRFIAEIQPDLGTDHMPALRLALRMHPDVIYFLTDAGEPGLSSFDLDEIRKLNNGQSRIHCVEFRSAEEPRANTRPNFMQTLAAENGGECVFRDVAEFDHHRSQAPRR